MNVLHQFSIYVLLMYMDLYWINPKTLININIDNINILIYNSNRDGGNKSEN